MSDQLDDNLKRARKLAHIAVAPVPLAVGIVVAILLLVATNPVVALLGFPLVVVGPIIGWATLVARLAPSAVVGATAAVEAERADEPRLYNLAEGLAMAAGVEVPRLWVADADAPNALVAANADEAHVVVTRGLLRSFSRIELEAVLAHQLAQIRSGEAALGSVAALALGGSPAVRGDGLAVAGLRVVLASTPITRALVARSGPARDAGWTDLDAVQITRYPPGLAEALIKSSSADTAGIPAEQAHLWLTARPAGGGLGAAMAHVVDERRPVADRIEILQEL